MICKKCGAEVADELTFCTGCGEEMEKEKKESLLFGSDKKKKMIVIGGCALGAIFLILLALLLLGGNGAETRVEDLYDSVLEYDANAVLEALPPEVLSYLKREINLEDSELEIINSRELKESRVQALDERYHELFGTDIGYIEDASVVEIELDYHGKSLSEDPIDLYMIKVDGNWYLDILTTLAELEEAEMKDGILPTLQDLLSSEQDPE